MSGWRSSDTRSLDRRNRVAATPSAAKSPITAVAAAAFVGDAPPKRRSFALAWARRMPTALDATDDERLREPSRFSAEPSFARAARAFTVDDDSKSVFVLAPESSF